MPGLGKTIEALARMRKAHSQGATSGDDLGLCEVRGFGFNPGALRMLSYVPDGLPSGAPLVVVLHGCTQSAGPYARAGGWLTLADRFGFALLAPEQDQANNPNRCFNWFEPEDIARDSGEAASIHAMVEHMVTEHGLDQQRIFVTGLSAGGAMTSVMLAAYPEVFAAGAIVAGLPFGVARNVQEAFGAMSGASRLGSQELGERVARAAPAPARKPRLSVWHGQADGTVASANAQTIAHQWTSYLGLDDQPSDVASRPGRIRSTWRDGDGQALVEMHLLANLGHGTPLASGGGDPIGHVAPFMLEAGVSSSLEICAFWGLAPEGDDDWAPQVAAPSPSPFDLRHIGDQVMGSVSPHVSAQIQKTIADALETAGLKRRNGGS